MNAPLERPDTSGWHLVVHRTVRAPLDIVWRYLMVDGARTWLGVLALPVGAGVTYETTDGTVGEVLSTVENGEIRLSWKPRRWLHGSTVDVTIAEAAAGTTIRLHHSGLANPDEKSEMLRYWEHVMTRVESDLTPIPDRRK